MRDRHAWGRTVLAVRQRDGWACVRCGVRGGVQFSVHHRRPRGAGGSRDPHTDCPCNLLTLCMADHGWVESRRADALAQGWLVRQGQSPSMVPVATRDGTLYLDCDGGMSAEIGATA